MRHFGTESTPWFGRDLTSYLIGRPGRCLLARPLGLGSPVNCLWGQRERQRREKCQKPPLMFPLLLIGEDYWGSATSWIVNKLLSLSLSLSHSAVSCLGRDLLLVPPVNFLSVVKMLPTRHGAYPPTPVPPPPLAPPCPSSSPTLPRVTDTTVCAVFQGGG